MTDEASIRFRRTREDHRSELAEDYVELIDTLISDCGEARVNQIASRLGVSLVTVSKTLKRLAREGFVIAEPYKAIELTEKGVSVAKEAQARHQVVVEFLVRIGVPAATAETDAEGIEHHVSPITLDAMKRHLTR